MVSVQVQQLFPCGRCSPARATCFIEAHAGSCVKAVTSEHKPGVIVERIAQAHVDTLDAVRIQFPILQEGLAAVNDRVTEQDPEALQEGINVCSGVSPGPLAVRAAKPISCRHDIGDHDRVQGGVAPEFLVLRVDSC